MENKKFDFEGFWDYMLSNVKCTESYFVREIFLNLVEYALENKAHTLDSAIFFLSDIIPDVEFGEIAMFADDSILTSFGKDEANAARKTLEEKTCR